MSEYSFTEIRIPVVGVAWLVVLCLIVLSRPGMCAENRQVKLMRSETHSSFVARLQAEIQIAGFSVSDFSGDTTPGESDIETVLHTSSAFVFIRELTRTVELYYRTRDGRMPHLVVPLPANDEEEQVTSLHIAEVLRVAFDRGTYRPEPVVVRPAPVSVGAAKPEKAENFIFQAAPELLWGDRTRSPQFGLNGAFGVGFGPGFHVALGIHAPIRGMTIQRPEGDIRILITGIDAHVGISPLLKVVRPLVTLGYQLWLLGATVDAATGFEGTKSFEVTGGPFLLVGGTWMLNNRTGITLGGSLAIAAPAVSYGVTNRNITTIGRPLMGVSLGISRFPLRSVR